MGRYYFDSLQTYKYKTQAGLTARGRLSTVDLVLNSLDQLIFILKILFSFL